MSNNDDSISDIVLALQALHVRQAALLDQLETHRPPQQAAARSRRGRTESEHRQASGVFHIGDHVRIKNPRALQPTSGRVIRISTTQITIQTPSGNTIVRAHKNLEHFSTE